MTDQTIQKRLLEVHGELEARDAEIDRLRAILNRYKKALTRLDNQGFEIARDALREDKP